jgi:translation initiation factor 2A
MASFESSANLPVPRLVVRDRSTVTLYEGPYARENADSTMQYSMKTISSPISSALRVPPIYDHNGQFVCVIPERDFPSVVNVSTGAKMFEINISDVQKAEFSPFGTFLITWSMAVKGTATDAVPNLRIFNVATGELVIGFSQKTYRNDLIQLAQNDSLCFRQVSNEVHIYHTATLSGKEVTAKVIHPGFTQFKIVKSESEDKINIAVFNPEAGGKPARVTLYALHLSTMSVEGPLNSRTIFGASEAILMWNKSGNSLLIHSQSDIDSSSASYYGATGLYLIHTKSDLSIKVEQTKEGPVHAVQWSPLGDKFVVSAGNMPCHSTMYNEKGEPIYQFGAAHRNVVAWAPHGRFLCLAGFGNLAGEMDFYDVIRLKKLGSNLSHCATTFQWSPDSRYFMTASLAPRMNVDNCFKIFKYNGIGPIAEENFENKAFDCYWKPIPSSIYPDRPPSPLKRKEDGSPVVATIPQKAAIPAAAPYRPPRSTGELSNFMTRGTEVAAGKVVKKDGGVTLVVAEKKEKFVPTAQRQRVIPGMAPPGAAAAATTNNNSNNSANQKKKPAVAPTTATATTAAAAAAAPSKPAVKAAPSAAVIESKPVASTATAAAPQKPVAAVVPASEETAESKEKKVKAIQKKLKQIQEIKAKVSSGQSVEPEQVTKT